MDYKGQKLCEYLYQVLLIVSGAISFTCGVYFDSFQIALYVYSVGFILTLLICVPNWPIYNKNPMKWQKARPTKIKIFPTVQEDDSPEEDQKDNTVDITNNEEEKQTVEQETLVDGKKKED